MYDTRYVFFIFRYAMAEVQANLSIIACGTLGVFCATPLRFIPLIFWFVIIILNIPSIRQGTRETSRCPLPLFPGLIASRKTLPDAHSHTLAHIQMSARARFHRSAGVGLRLRELLAGFDHGFPQRAGSTSRRLHPASAKADPERMCA